MQQAKKEFLEFRFFETRSLPRVGPPLAGFGRSFGIRKLVSKATVWPNLDRRRAPTNGPKKHKNDVEKPFF